MYACVCVCRCGDVGTSNIRSRDNDAEELSSICSVLLTDIIINIWNEGFKMLTFADFFDIFTKISLSVSLSGKWFQITQKGMFSTYTNKLEFKVIEFPDLWFDLLYFFC